MKNDKVVTMEDLLRAYEDCMVHKGGKRSAIRFDCNKEKLLYDLYLDINNGNYKPSKSTAFVVTHPKEREVFAADFRDRIVHHWIALRLVPILNEKILIPNVYSCIEGRGTLYGQVHLKEQIIEISKNYTQEAWVAKFDIKHFFNGINKEILWEKVKDIVENYYVGKDKEMLFHLIDLTIKDRPEENCELHGDKKLWRLLPPDRTLFKSEGIAGIPIGNLVSQLFANIYLNNLDHFLYNYFGGYYGRYVDDFYVLCTSKDKIKNIIPSIRKELQKIKLELHPKKFYLQPVNHGVAFIGATIKYDRIYINNKTLGHIHSKMNGMKYSEDKIASINSYLGFFKHVNEYSTKRGLIRLIDNSWYKNGYFSEHHDKFVKKQKYKMKVKIMMKESEFKQLIQIENNWYAQWGKSKPNEDGEISCWRMGICYKDKPSNQKIIDVISDELNKEINYKIVTGFVWKDKDSKDHSVWLSSENQSNFKTQYDIAKQTKGSNLPVLFKIGGTNSNPDIIKFETVEDLEKFIVEETTYIQKTLEEGWAEKQNLSNEFK